jgi:hypothetical protein
MTRAALLRGCVLDRALVAFKDAGNVTWGSTSVVVTTQ